MLPAAGTGAADGYLMSSPHAEPHNFADLLTLARDAAQGAGDLLRAGWGTALDIETKSSSTDSVTNMDRAAEQLIVDIILTARPEDGILGEEGGSRPASSGVRWVIDPLDGTTNYIYGLSNWAVSIAAGVLATPGDESSMWTALAGVVHLPAQSTTYIAHRGGGATRIDDTKARSMTPSGCEALGQALVGTGFSYDGFRRADQGRVVAELLPRVRDIRRFGAASIDLCLVADGRIDAFYESGLAPWDRAAGELIAREAGADIREITEKRDGDAEPILLVSAPGIGDALADLITSVRR